MQEIIASVLAAFVSLSIWWLDKWKERRDADKKTEEASKNYIESLRVTLDELIKSTTHLMVQCKSKKTELSIEVNRIKSSELGFQHLRALCASVEADISYFDYSVFERHFSVESWFLMPPNLDFAKIGSLRVQLMQLQSRLNRFSCLEAAIYRGLDRSELLHIDNGIDDWVNEVVLSVDMILASSDSIKKLADELFSELKGV